MQKCGNYCRNLKISFASWVISIHPLSFEAGWLLTAETNLVIRTIPIGLITTETLHSLWCDSHNFPRGSKHLLFILEDIWFTNNLNPYIIEFTSSKAVFISVVVKFLINFGFLMIQCAFHFLYNPKIYSLRCVLLVGIQSTLKKYQLLNQFLQTSLQK